MHLLRKLIQKTGFDLHRHRLEPDKLSYFKTFNIKTVLDIGANVGQFAKEIREILPDAQIYSFEPLKECFGKLPQGASLGKFGAFNFALGDKEETKEINKSSYTPSSSLLPMTNTHKTLFPHTKKHSQEKIEIKRLDDVAKDLKLEKEILIKVDVQGFEDKVIAGGVETFKKAKVVLIENSFVELYESQPLFDDIYMKLKELGFEYRGALQQKIAKNTGQIISEDSMFIRYENHAK
ncbi:MAG: FkbM family methyltransferase [Patescibacteria group bacterium]